MTNEVSYLLTIPTAVHPKNSVLLIPTRLTVTCVMQLILLSWQHECHKNPSNKPPPCACLR
ncbi:MAG TPA: hypothetical protein VMW95_01665, partial [Desulfobacterales bacterium]|nr:hypothetical protein [Desulfobacterales bacterium]